MATARELVERAGRLVDQRQRTHALALRHFLYARVYGQVAAHVHGGVDEVDVAPAQRPQLTEAQAGVAGHAVQGGVSVPLAPCDGLELRHASAR